MSSDVKSPRSGLPRPKRLKIDIACETCRAKKIKCDGSRPVCRGCQKRSGLRDRCKYHVRRDTTSPAGPRVATSQAAGIGLSDASGFRGGHSISIPGNFAREVNATFEAKFGFSSVEKSVLIPMTDAPLFGLLPRRQLLDDSQHHVQNVLPPRRHADHLVALYWQYIQPLEPFLDKERFMQSYEALFAGNVIDLDEKIFLSSLNAVFALSTQIQECMDPKEREAASNTYFHRAWALLDPGNIIWETGTIEIVQCLLLMGRYLQCTKSTHQTWMAIGSAVRIAQSLGLHVIERESQFSNKDKQLRRQLWRCCVFMDRGICWVLGRTSMVSHSVSSAAVQIPEEVYKAYPDLDLSTDFFVKTLELYEINNHIMLSQVSAPCDVANRLKLPHLYQDQNHFGIAMQLDDCLDIWDKGLPLPLKYDPLDQDVNDTLQRQRVTLQLRFLHSRIFLFRPMLARLCLFRPDDKTNLNSTEGLKDHVLRDCATWCVENAQKMINLVHDYYKPKGSAYVAVIPWWYRIFYLHIASIVLIAAKLRSDLFGAMVSESWNKAMSTLQVHGYLSPYIMQCFSTFQMLSRKIAESQLSTSSDFPSGDSFSGPNIQDIFSGTVFESDHFLPGAEDMSWLTDTETFQ